jgi:hypothetical protein
VTKRRVLLAALAAVIVAAPLAAAVFVPPLLDWNRYRGTIAAVAAEKLGRSVTISGPVSLALWPAPELTAEQVDVGGEGLHVAALRLRVGLWPLLGGRVEARDLVLRGLDARLPWPLPQTVLASRPPRWLRAFAARIEGGTLHLGELTVGSIDATVTQGEDGMLEAAGTAQLDAQAGRFSLRLGRPGGDGTATLEVALDGNDKLAGTGANFTGVVAADGSVSGQMTARGTDLALLIGAPSLAFHAEGRLTIGDGLAAMDEATFDLAGAPASGAVALRWTPIARLDVALSATRLDLDPWLAAVLPATGRRALRAGLPIGLDLAVEAARLGGGMVQRLRARADMDGGTVKLSDVSASLPGEAELQMDGTIDAAAGAAPRLVGKLRLAAPALRTTLHWLNDSGIAKVPLPPGAVLQTATIAATLRTEPGSFVLEGLTGRVDGAAIAGSLRLVGGAHPGFAVDVATDRLALDPWLSGDIVAQATAAPARWLGHGGMAALVGGETAQVAIRAEQATLRGLPIEGLVLDAAAAPDGRLTLRQLDGTAAGLRLSAAGTIGGDGRVIDARLSLEGTSAKPLANLVPAGLVTSALWKGPVALTIEGGGPPSALALGLTLELADGRLEAQPVINLNSGAWHASATLQHPGAARLLTMLGVVAPPATIGTSDWLGDGSVSLLGQFSGAPGAEAWGRLAADSFELTAGTLRASGQLAVDGRQVSGTVDADVLPVPLSDPASQAPLPIEGLRGWRGMVHVQAAQIVAGPVVLLDHAALAVTLASDILTLKGLTGHLGSGVLAGTASLNFAASPPTLSAAGTLHDVAIHSLADDVAVGVLSGRIDATADLAATGYSPAALLATLSGSLQAAIRDGALAGFDLFGAEQAMARVDAGTATDTEQDLRAALQAGTTSFDRLDLTGEATHGLLRLTSARLQGTAGSAQAQGSIDLADGTLDLQVTLTPSVPGAPPVGLRLDGLFSAPIRQPELAAASRWLAERPATR